MLKQYSAQRSETDIMLSILEYVQNSNTSSIVNYIMEARKRMMNRKNTEIYTYYNCRQRNDKRFNFVLTSEHGAERDTERIVSSDEVVSLMKDCWSRIVKGIKDGKILIN